MRIHLNPFCLLESIALSGSVNQIVVPVEGPISRSQFRPFLPESLLKSLQGLNDLSRIHRGSPGHIVFASLTLVPPLKRSTIKSHT